jgi:L-aspartate oxidase
VDRSLEFDVLVIGSGLAGLCVALSVAPARRVALICKRKAADGATDHAQGGIAAALASDDDFNRHVADTLVAGGGLCDEAITRSIVEDAPACIAWLAAQGVRFTRAGEGRYHLTREGGHSRRRIVHADDATGHQIHRVLADQARMHANVTLLEDYIAIDLVTRNEGDRAHCVGVRALDSASGRIVPIAASATVLATGGAAGLYRYTSNPAGATGDGIAMAHRAGCAVTNLEFVQFHPTCLVHPGVGAFLISEAVRGEGGVLRLPSTAGSDARLRFMPLHDQRAELAPRDIVARAVAHEMRTRALTHVDLDISGQPAAHVLQRFPTIHARLLALGIDMTREPIPVAPAAHFTCGGVVASRTGRTGLDDLYAVGEVACTGLHGANRLASNSLLECVAMGRAAGRDILSKPRRDVRSLPVSAARAAAPPDVEAIGRCRESLRETMWNDVGIVRSTRGLADARLRIEQWRAEHFERSVDTEVTCETIELRNALDVASLIVASALSRHESRGAHHNVDHPGPSPRLASPTVLVPGWPAHRSPVGNGKRAIGWRS